jgi:hypothetical protein
MKWPGSRARQVLRVLRLPSTPCRRYARLPRWLFPRNCADLRPDQAVPLDIPLTEAELRLTGLALVRTRRMAVRSKGQAKPPQYAARGAQPSDGLLGRDRKNPCLLSPIHRLLDMRLLDSTWPMSNLPHPRRTPRSKGKGHRDQRAWELAACEVVSLAWPRRGGPPPVACEGASLAVA